MKKGIRIYLSLFFAMIFWVSGSNVEASEAVTIRDGIYIEDIALSGMVEAEATEAVNTYIESLKAVMLTLTGVEGKSIQVTAGEMGLVWTNTEIIEEAVELGQSGNVVTRYKAQKDLEHTNQIYEIQLDFDQSVITEYVESHSDLFNQDAIDMKLVKTGTSFTTMDGQIGYFVDSEASGQAVYSYLLTEWDRTDSSTELVILEETPMGTAEELATVTNLLGTFTTSYLSSSTARVGNITNGTNLINGITLYPGETFSMFDYILPFSVDNGYYMAGSYLNGTVVDSLGGGICQVSTTLYNAVLMAELEVTERYNHSMAVSYVSPAQDAAIAESAGKDFQFVNTTDYPIYIEGIASADKTVTFNIYGKETRSASRTISYEYEIVETIVPTTEAIVQTTSQPLGYISVQSAYTGYKSKLWKVVTENGVEVSRTQVNSSNYSMVPRTATVGIATENTEAYNQLQEAIATGSIDEVRVVADAWAAVNAQAAAEATAAAAAETPVE